MDVYDVVLFISQKGQSRIVKTALKKNFSKG